jgi:hypothetical protein
VIDIFVEENYLLRYLFWIDFDEVDIFWKLVFNGQNLNDTFKNLNFSRLLNAKIIHKNCPPLDPISFKLNKNKRK